MGFSFLFDFSSFFYDYTIFPSFPPLRCFLSLLSFFPYSGPSFFHLHFNRSFFFAFFPLLFHLYPLSTHLSVRLSFVAFNLPSLPPSFAPFLFLTQQQQQPSTPQSGIKLQANDITHLFLSSLKNNNRSSLLSMRLLPSFTDSFLYKKNICDSLDYARDRLLAFNINFVERKRTRENAGKEKEEERNTFYRTRL